MKKPVFYANDQIDLFMTWNGLNLGEVDSKVRMKDIRFVPDPNLSNQKIVRFLEIEFDDVLIMVQLSRDLPREIGDNPDKNILINSRFRISEFIDLDRSIYFEIIYSENETHADTEHLKEKIQVINPETIPDEANDLPLDGPIIKMSYQKDMDRPIPTLNQPSTAKNEKKESKKKSDNSCMEILILIFIVLSVVFITIFITETIWTQLLPGIVKGFLVFVAVVFLFLFFSNSRKN